MDVRELLSQKINMPQIEAVVSWACESPENRWLMT